MTHDCEWPEKPEAESILLDAVIPVAPLPKGRARHSRGGAVYNPRTTKKYEQELAWLLKEACQKRNEIDDLGVFAVFHTKTRQRRDLDNLLKSLLDAGNRIVWEDDRQVKTIVSRLIHGDGKPRIELTVFIVNQRSKKCQRRFGAARLAHGRDNRC